MAIYYDIQLFDTNMSTQKQQKESCLFMNHEAVYHKSK